MSMPIQLAIQGGGAKLMALLAAMEAVEEMEGKVVDVKRLCGTSAGAIVACLYAAGVKMEVAKTELVNAFHGKIAELFPIPGDFGFGWHIWKRNEIWSAEPVRKVFSNLFESKKVKIMRDLKIPTAIIASDLTSSNPVTRSSWGTPDLSVVQALLDSMALPFFFRMWNDNENPVYVDGGICNNLPSSVLLDEYEAGVTAAQRAARGEVYAFSFPPDGVARIKSAKDFAFALVNTAIDSAIQREKSRLAGRVHEIRTSLTTLDFDDALKMDPAAYREIKKDAAEFFQNHASGSGKRWILQDLWKEQNLTLLQALWRIYKAQNTAKNIQYQSCRLIWLARGLADPHAPDDMHFKAMFKIGSVPLQCHSIGVTQSGATFLGQMEFSVFEAGSKTKAVSYETLPARDPANPLNRQLLFNYLPALPVGSGPYRMHFREAIKDFSKTFLETRKDEFVYTPRRADGNVGVIELILQVPENRKIEFEYLPDCAKRAEVMEGDDFFDVDTPFGYYSYGWRIKDWPGETEFGVNLKLP